MTSVKNITRVALAMGLALPASAAADPPHKLFVYGDSMAVGTEPFMPEALPDWRVKQDVVVDRHLPGTARVLREKGERLAPVVHISMGTVDDPERPGRFRRGVRRTLRAAGPERCVVWPNIWRPVWLDQKLINGWDPLNDVLTQEAERRSNLLIVDWVAMVKRHWDWLSTYDGTHVSEAGNRARARAVARASEECYERLRLRGTS